MDKQLAQSIGRGARDARTRARLTQADVAERLGMASEVYGRLERGLMLPRVATLAKLCRELSVSSDDLLGLRDADPSARSAGSISPEDGARPEGGVGPGVRRLLRRVKTLDRRTLRLLHVLAAALARGQGEDAQ